MNFVTISPISGRLGPNLARPLLVQNRVEFVFERIRPWVRETRDPADFHHCASGPGQECIVAECYIAGCTIGPNKWQIRKNWAVWDVLCEGTVRLRSRIIFRTLHPLFETHIKKSVHLNGYLVQKS